MTVHINLFNHWCKCHRRKENHVNRKVIFQKGLSKMNEDLNLVSLIESISKLKATVAVLVGERESIVHKI